MQGIRDTRSKDLLVELRCSKEGRRRLDTTLKEVIGASGTVRHLIPMIQVEIADIKPSILAENVEDAISGFLGHGSELELKMSLRDHTKKTERKQTHIKIGWVSCRVRRKMEVNRC